MGQTEVTGIALRKISCTKMTNEFMKDQDATGLAEAREHYCAAGEVTLNNIRATFRDGCATGVSVVSTLAV